MDMQTASQQIRALSRSYQAVIEIGAFLDTLGNLENSYKEISSKLEKVRAQVAQEQAALEALQAKKSDIDSHVSAVLGEAQAQAQPMIDEAAASIATATREAERIVEKAQARARKIQEETDKRNTVLEDLDAKISAKQSEHKAVLSLIAEAKAKIRSI